MLLQNLNDSQCSTFASIYLRCCYRIIERFTLCVVGTFLPLYIYDVAIELQNDSHSVLQVLFCLYISTMLLQNYRTIPTVCCRYFFASIYLRCCYRIIERFTQCVVGTFMPLYIYDVAIELQNDSHSVLQVLLCLYISTMLLQNYRTIHTVCCRYFFASIYLRCCYRIIERFTQCVVGTFLPLYIHDVAIELQNDSHSVLQVLFCLYISTMLLLNYRTIHTVCCRYIFASIYLRCCNRIIERFPQCVVGTFLPLYIYDVAIELQNDSHSVLQVLFCLYISTMLLQNYRTIHTVCCRYFYASIYLRCCYRIIERFPQCVVGTFMPLYIYDVAIELQNDSHSVLQVLFCLYISTMLLQNYRTIHTVCCRYFFASIYPRCCY